MRVASDRRGRAGPGGCRSGESVPPAAGEPTGVPREERPARVPPEARGLARDGVRLLVARGGAVEHARFSDLPRFLRPGDLVIVNTSATLPAALDVVRRDGAGATIHFSTRLDDGSWLVELRPRGAATAPVHDARPGERVTLPGGVRLTLREAWPDPDSPRTRLWRARVPAGVDVVALMRAYGRPIAYAYVRGRWPLDVYQTLFARHPGSAEMPSAGRPFSLRVVVALARAGVGFAPVLLHTGVSSPEAGESPLPERYRVPRSTARRVMDARSAGGRIVAVGTTAARAIESVAAEEGAVRPGSGWTSLVLGPARPARVVDGILTGWHARGASHLRLLEAVAGPEVVRRAYDAAHAAGYLWHEFGDSCLLLP